MIGENRRGTHLRADDASIRTAAIILTPYSLHRHSYRVEANFLGSKVCRNLAEDVGIAVPRAFYTDMRPDDETAIESKFSMLLEDFAPENGWRQSGLLGVEEIKASLMALAKFHAYFMNDKIADELEGAIWQSGTYWQVSHQPEMQFSELAQHYEDQIERFGECKIEREANRRTVGAK